MSEAVTSPSAHASSPKEPSIASQVGEILHRSILSAWGSVRCRTEQAYENTELEGEPRDDGIARKQATIAAWRSSVCNRRGGGRRCPRHLGPGQRTACKGRRAPQSPQGQFLEIDGARLHYVERGEGEPLVLLHGNGSMIQDFESSGLLDKAAKKYRVIVFDRPDTATAGARAARSGRRKRRPT